MTRSPTLSTLTAGLQDRRDLAPAEIVQAASALLAPEIDEASKGDFLAALRAKGETAAEIAGFAEALLAHAVNPEIDPALAPGPLLDVCGTGGDQLDLFNVSTTSMFVLAAGGATVVKHGNRAITSQAGGADVLEALGVRIDLPPAALRECVQRLGLGFLFAPAYHPAFKAIAPVRKRLASEGIPTIFNLLGPLLNPARPPYQLIGLFSKELLPKYAEAIALLPRRRVWAVHGSGMDELSTTGPASGPPPPPPWTAPPPPARRPSATSPLLPPPPRPGPSRPPPPTSASPQRQSPTSAAETASKTPPSCGRS